MKKAFHVLLLGGTGEARQLADRIGKFKGIHVIASLAGVTRHPKAYPVETRTGGFGGVDGLVRFISEQHIDLVVNATHPFAETMTANAAKAAGMTATPLFRLLRDPWRPNADDRWQDVADLDQAIAAIPGGARVLFATGRGSVEQLAKTDPSTDFWAAIRLIVPSDQEFPLPHGEFIQAQPPFSLEEELDLMKQLEISYLVTKNAGGVPGTAKLEAARQLGIAVIAIDRPAQPAGQIIATDLAEMTARIKHAMSQWEPDKA